MSPSGRMIREENSGKVTPMFVPQVSESVNTSDDATCYDSPGDSSQQKAVLG